MPPRKKPAVKDRPAAKPGRSRAAQQQQPKQPKRGAARGATTALAPEASSSKTHEITPARSRAVGADAVKRKLDFDPAPTIGTASAGDNSDVTEAVITKLHDQLEKDHARV